MNLQVSLPLSEETPQHHFCRNPACTYIIPSTEKYCGFCTGERFEGIPPEDPKNVSAAEILEAGVAHMKNRASTYDKPGGERSMGATVTAFNAATGQSLTEEQGWLFMVLLKVVRAQQGNFKLDSYEDGAAYFGLAGEAAQQERL